MPEPTIEQQVETLEEKVEALTDLVADLIEYIEPSFDSERKLASVRKGLSEVRMIR